MSGPLPKDPNRRQRRNSHHGAVVPFRSAGLVVAPPMPPGLLVTTQALWRAFWSSPLAAAVEPATDTAAIVRLHTLYDERERAYRAYKRQRIMQGSQGQRILSPMARAMNVFDAEIRQLEDRLGMSPRSRLQLGIQLGEAAKSLQELNRVLDDDDEQDDDPR